MTAWYELLTTTFEMMERNIREQLMSLLSAGGFDPAEDIAGITVQRSRSGMGPELRIGSRKDEIPFGQGVSKDALDWLKRYLTAAIATA